MDSVKKLANALASAFCEARLCLPDMTDNAERLFDRRQRWIQPLAKRVIKHFGQKPPSSRLVAKFIVSDRGFLKARRKRELRITGSVPAPRAMRPMPAAASWRVPTILSAGDLANWLEVSMGELLWFADLKRLNGNSHNDKASDPTSYPLSHYHIRLLQKSIHKASGLRCIEAPKPRLKAIQKKILETILNPVPVHDACHGFRKGRSIQTFAADHAGTAMVMKLDLKDFFPSIAAGRVYGLFHSLGYPEEVARLLTGLCTVRTPMEVWQGISHSLPASQRELLRQKAWFYDSPHLPQGAPTSPMLANLCAFRLDCRLTGLARCASATYSRYADDLAFSGDDKFARKAKHLLSHVQATVMEEGFQVHFRKTRLMRQASQQRLVGLTVNQHPNVSRKERDRLQAILCNCVRFGPETQNREENPHFREYLQGRIAFVEQLNLAHGRKLRDWFEQIEWESEPNT